MDHVQKRQFSTKVRLLCLTALTIKARGEDKALYRYEDYQEDGARIRIQTHGLYVDKQGRSVALSQGQLYL